MKSVQEITAALGAGKKGGKKYEIVFMAPQVAVGSNQTSGAPAEDHPVPSHPAEAEAAAQAEAEAEAAEEERRRLEAVRKVEGNGIVTVKVT